MKSTAAVAALILISISLADPLSIASFGGSITWGSALHKGELAWPVLLGHKFENAERKNVRVYNYAMRAKSSFSAAMCLLDILHSPPPTTFNSKNRLVQNKPPTEPIDIIILEYSINGADNINLLIMKLRLRFPNAQILYLATFALQAEIRLCNESKSIMARKYPRPFLHTAETCWIKRQSWFRAGVKEARENNIQVVNFPYRTNPVDHLADFASDWHHLNARGHAIAASLLYNAIELQEKHLMHKQLSFAQRSKWLAHLTQYGYPVEPILETCWTFKNQNHTPQNWKYNKNSNSISFTTAGLSKANAIATSSFNIAFEAFNGANMYIQFKSAANKPNYGFITVATNAMSTEIDTKAPPEYTHHAFRLKHIGILQCPNTSCNISVSAHSRETVQLTGLYLNPYDKVLQ